MPTEVNCTMYGNSHCSRGTEAHIAGIAGDERGTIMVEYAVLLALVSVGCATAVAALGVPLVRMYLVQEVWLMLAVP